MIVPNTHSRDRMSDADAGSVLICPTFWNRNATLLAIIPRYRIANQVPPEIPVKEGDVLKMPRGCKHTVLARRELTIIEVQLGREINVADKIKYEG